MSAAASWRVSVGGGGIGLRAQASPVGLGLIQCADGARQAFAGFLDAGGGGAAASFVGGDLGGQALQLGLAARPRAASAAWKTFSSSGMRLGSAAARASTSASSADSRSRADFASSTMWPSRSRASLMRASSGLDLLDGLGGPGGLAVDPVAFR